MHDQPSSTEHRPVFVKGSLRFTVDKHELKFDNINVSDYGVMSLQWGPLLPTVHFGLKVTAHVKVFAQADLPDLDFVCPSLIVREQSSLGDLMGLKFYLGKALLENLVNRVQKLGFIPTDHIRKYPRIPSLKVVQTSPLRALVTAAANGAHPSSFPLIFDVANLSPNGVLIQTENQAAMVYEPGHRIDVLLEPRGWFPNPIKATGLICRITDERDPESQNIMRYLGVKLVKIDDENYTLFMSLLKDILQRIQQIT